MMDIYKHKSEFKVLVFVIALLIGGVSLYYTDTLVKKLVEREKEQIELYASALRFTLDPENNEPLTFIFDEIIKSNQHIPVILTDHEENIITYKNIDIPPGVSPERKERILQRELEIMKQEHPPIIVEYEVGAPTHNKIYYRNSDLIYQLRWYPYAQLSVIAIFGFLTYLAFSYSRKAEQNRIWVGLAKETAHQLGTPISSLMAWIELLKHDEQFKNHEVLGELEKDIKRLQITTERFSNIGSKPTFKPEDPYEVVKEIVDYLRPRISPKIEVEVVNYTLQGTRVLMNRHLFQWVIENLCKNAVDAMNGAGKIEIKLKVTANHKKTIIDVTDTGKGIPKSKFKKIFAPGYTTKKRGWGLGLTLAKRIVENYHKGRIFVKASEIDKGTKFRIILPNQQTEGVESYELVNKKNPLRKVLESLEKGNSLSEKD
jgi:hypothetical protein